MMKAGGERFLKDVDFVEKDGEEQIATGIVMVPDTVDLQGDFVRDDTIERFADQFETFIDAGEADGGVMHAVWPSDHMELISNEVVETASEIGGETVPAGAWVQEWHFTDSELWSLVEDGILEGYSIGAVDVTWAGPMGQDDLPGDIDVAEGYPDSEPVWELLSGIIREISTVDIPAVPDALILETKDAYEKRLADYLGDRDGFIEEAMSRGHTEADAERLWDYLNRAVQVDGAGTPGKGDGLLTRAGKAFLNSLGGNAPVEKPSVGKEGHTLSTANLERAMAMHDIAEDLIASELGDTGFVSNRFTDDPSFDFELGGWEPKHKEGHTKTDSMTDTDDIPSDEPPEWAKSLIEDVEQLKNDREEKEEDENTDADKGDDDEPPEWAKDLREEVESLKEASGQSQQIDGGNTLSEKDENKARKAAVIFGGFN